MILIPILVVVVILVIAVAFMRRKDAEDNPFSAKPCVIDEEATEARRAELRPSIEENAQRMPANLRSQYIRNRLALIKVCKPGTGSGAESDGDFGLHQAEGRVPTDKTVRRAALRAVEDIARTNPGCAPMAIQWQQVARADAERGAGFLGIPRAIRRARLGRLARELGSCIAGVDLTRFGFRDASQLIMTLTGGAYEEIDPASEPEV